MHKLLGLRGNYSIKDLPDKPKCPRCGSFALGLLKVDEEKALPLIEKKAHLAKDEEKLQLHAKHTAELIEKYGKAAAVALSADVSKQQT